MDADTDCDSDCHAESASAAHDNALKSGIIAHDVNSAKMPGGCKQSADSRPLIMPDFKHQRTAFNQQRGTLRNPAAIHLKTVRAAVKGLRAAHTP